jgi:hypothetical protein
MESGWGPWLIGPKTSAEEALYLVGGINLYFGWLAVWVSNPDWRSAANISERQFRRLDEGSTPGGGGGGVRAVPRICIKSIYALTFALQLRKITVKPQSGLQKSARLISAEHDSFGRLGHRVALASTGLLAPVALGLHFGRRGSTVGQSICRVAELRISPHQLTLCRSSQWGLLCGRRQHFPCSHYP